ncbi:hypothetical protein Tco_1210074 [Tanacetum coccineum]
MVDLIQNNLSLEKRLDKQGTRLYNLENLNIPHKESQAVDEIVTDAVDWAMQAPLRARFRDLLTVDIKEILQQRMFEDNSYKAHEVHNDLYEALQKSLELDYSNQCLADQEEARKKKRKKRAAPRTPSGSPPSLPPPPPPLAGASGVPGSEALSSSKPAVSTHQYMAWTTSDTRFESTDFMAAQELSLTDSLMQDDSIPDEQVHLSDDKDSGNDHLPKVDSRQDWWKPLPKEKRLATPKPAWTIPSSNVSDIENNWASTLVLTYETPVENSLLVKTGDMTTFMKCSRWRSVTICSQIRLTGRIQKEIKSESMSTNHYLSVVLQGSNPTLSISKMKAASYPDFGLELLVPKQIWIDDVCTYDMSAKYGISHWWFNRQKFYIDIHDSLSRRKDVRTHMRILSVVKIKAYSRYEYDYLSEIVLRRADF